MAVHGTRRRESVSWDYRGLLQYLASIASERCDLPLLRCYWYEATLEGRRTGDHDILADLPGVKLRVAKMRPGRREGVEGEIHRDLTTLARNKAISDALIISAEEDLAQVIGEVQDLGVRVLIAHITVDGNWTISRALRQECDDIVEIASSRLRPYAELIAGAEPSGTDETDEGTLVSLRPQSNGNGTGGHQPQPGQAEIPTIYAAPVVAEYQRAARTPQLAPPAITQRPEESAVTAYREEPHADEAALRKEAVRDLPPRDLPGRQEPASQRKDLLERPDIAARQDLPSRSDQYGSPPPVRRDDIAGYAPPRDRSPARGNGVHQPGSPASGPQPTTQQPGYPPVSQSQGAPSQTGPLPSGSPYALPPSGQAPAPQPGSRGMPYGSPPAGAPAYSAAPPFPAPPVQVPLPPAPPSAQTGPQVPVVQPSGQQPAAVSLGEAVQSAHAEGEDFGASVARDAPALWLEAVLARKPRMPSDLEARLLQGSALPIDFLLHDEVRHALRRGFWDALERARR
jgi:uncharacterized LabA/DUF88 family protein